VGVSVLVAILLAPPVQIDIQIIVKPAMLPHGLNTTFKIINALELVLSDIIKIRLKDYAKVNSI